MSQPDCNTLPHGTVTLKRAGTAFAVCRWSIYLAGNHLHQKSYCVLAPSVLCNKIHSETFWHKSNTFYMVLSEFEYNEKQSSYYHLKHSRFIKAIYIYMDFFFIFLEHFTISLENLSFTFRADKYVSLVLI